MKWSTECIALKMMWGYQAFLFLILIIIKSVRRAYD